MKHIVPLIFTLSATAAFAEDTRELDSHEHGVGELNIALDGTTIAMEFHAPGADIVGFEYEATSDEDLAKIAAAIEVLERPLDLFVVPAAAGCEVQAAHAALESEHEEEHGHDEHGHDEHDDHAKDDHDEHGHDDHADEKHDDHDHEEHADEKHDDHGDHGHDEHAHDEHDHDEHGEEEAGHTEFHAEYELTCANPLALSPVTFAYFEMFPNALEVEVQVASPIGAKAFEVERDNPQLDLKGLF